MHAPLAPGKRILLKAAEVLREKGHCKKTVQDDKGRVCALGAIITAAELLGFRDPHDFVSCDEHVNNAVSLMMPKDFSGTFAEWNDKPERTADGVIRAMERAALT